MPFMRAFTIAIFLWASAFFPTLAQTSAPDTQDQEHLTTVIKEVRAQQTDLVANQAKIDEKLAALAEAIRQARLYSSRGGR
jgi:hypothetical protein